LKALILILVAALSACTVYDTNLPQEVVSPAPPAPSLEPAMVKLACAQEGQTISGGAIGRQSCCEGLKYAGKFTHENLEKGCDFPPPPGSIGSCVKCGDGKCDKKHFENKCVCPEDCK
jgi:hypothetical protein